MAVDYVELGARIREQRLKKKMTQAELAELMGITPSFLGHIERASRVASLETLVSACNALHVSPSYLLASSLELDDEYRPEAIPTDTRMRLNAFLKMAEDAINHWNDD